MGVVEEAFGWLSTNHPSLYEDELPTAAAELCKEAVEQCVVSADKRLVELIDKMGSYCIDSVEDVLMEVTKAVHCGHPATMEFVEELSRGVVNLYSKNWDCIAYNALGFVWESSGIREGTPVFVGEELVVSALLRAGMLALSEETLEDYCETCGCTVSELVSGTEETRYPLLEKTIRRAAEKTRESCARTESMVTFGDCREYQVSFEEAFLKCMEQDNLFRKCLTDVRWARLRSHVKTTRPVAIFWQGCTQERLCAEGGVGKKMDIEEYDTDTFGVGC